MLISPSEVPKKERDGPIALVTIVAGTGRHRRRAVKFGQRASARNWNLLNPITESISAPLLGAPNANVPELGTGSAVAVNRDEKQQNIPLFPVVASGGTIRLKKS